MEVNAIGVPRNEFWTFWDKSNIELSRGLDFVPRGSIFARITHLQHIPFNYKITVSSFVDIILLISLIEIKFGHITQNSILIIEAVIVSKSQMLLHKSLKQ